ncbi:MAG: gamma-glutamyl-gamma-aminobutyrate hydrolase family protein [Planctomycetota bacterium]|jgi:gamma-glutamyl-gamma-aminobutyrate hydrolase PuuD
MLLILLAGVVLLPVLLAGGFWLFRSVPPAGGPGIGYVVGSSYAIRRPLYEEIVARAGGRPMLITPGGGEGDIEALLDKVDGLLLTGGEDIDPGLYGGSADEASGTNRGRDEFEIRLIRGAVERDMPILGICRGIQILNVAYGGTIRNLRDDEKLSDVHGIDINSLTAHEITVVEGSRLAGVVGAGVGQVNSFHGQAVGEVGDKLRVCATAPDGVVEGLERPDCTFVVGIQWHPEVTSLADKSVLVIFEELVRQADAYRNRQRSEMQTRIKQYK